MNNLLVLFDELCADSLSCYGASLSTPAFDRLAASGDIFSNCYSDKQGQLLTEWLHDHATNVIAVQTTIASNESSRLPDSLSGLHQSGLQLIRAEVNSDAEKADFLLSDLFQLLDSTSAKFDSLIVTALSGRQSQQESDTSGPLSLNEKTHVPLIVSHSEQTTTRRRSDLLTTSDVLELLKYMEKSQADYANFRDHLPSKEIAYELEDLRATRNRDWLLIRSSEAEMPDMNDAELYRKPEDIWETWNVIQQYPQVLENFLETGKLNFPSDD